MNTCRFCPFQMALIPPSSPSSSEIMDVFRLPPLPSTFSIVRWRTSSFSLFSRLEILFPFQSLSSSEPVVATEMSSNALVSSYKWNLWQYVTTNIEFQRVEFLCKKITKFSLSSSSVTFSSSSHFFTQDSAEPSLVSPPRSSSGTLSSLIGDDFLPVGLLSIWECDDDASSSSVMNNFSPLDFLFLSEATISSLVSLSIGISEQLLKVVEEAIIF